MSETKIQFSQVELELAANAGVILTKNAIIEKVKLLFADLQLQQQAALLPFSQILPAELYTSSPKIYRGEKYNELPYVLLDYPQVFTKENVFAIRTLFWWGHFFSCTLHVSGEYKSRFLPALLTNHERLKTGDFYLCINEDEWEHHFDEGNYISIAALTTDHFENNLKGKNFIKLAIKTPIADLSGLPVILLEYFREFLHVLQISHPGGETIL